jgi:hypothetical protein
MHKGTVWLDLCYSENFESKRLREFLQMRGTLTKHLVGLGVQNLKVMDTCCHNQHHHSQHSANRLADLQKVTANDGIHFTPDGYKNLATRCTVCSHTLTNTPKKAEKQGTHFWRAPEIPRASNHSGRTPYVGEAPY